MEYFYIPLVLIGCYLILRTKNALHILQQNSYNLDGRYFKWILTNRIKIYTLFDHLTLLLALIFVFIFDKNFVLISTSVLYFVGIIISFLKMKKETYKLKFKVTSRIKRLIFTIFLIYTIPTLLIVLNFDINHLHDYFYGYILIGYLQYYVVLLALFINSPIERLVYYYYYFKAKKKLKGMKSLDVIGITGSYGKTSSKNILSDILNIKYNVLPSPKNFNTPYGLMITVNNYLDKFTDLLIAEMGAYRKGEIKELCDFVQPKYGILTKIGVAHLESFGSQENIQVGKFELIESLPQDGIGILNRDDELQVKYQLKNKVKIIWIGIENKADYTAENIKITKDGSTFDVFVKAENKSYKFQTKLLGKTNIYNLLAGIALGHQLGINFEQLQQVVKLVKPVEHRLELKKYGTINIIDDAYNSNPLGAKTALEVLKMMKGKKIIVTAGMIELGEQQNKLNKQLGKDIAEVCDEVILIGKNQTKPIYDGLVDSKFSKLKIHVLSDITDAFPLVRKLDEGNTYLLIENDLPDIFNE